MDTEKIFSLNIYKQKSFCLHQIKFQRLETTKSESRETESSFIQDKGDSLDKKEELTSGMMMQVC